MIKGVFKVKELIEKLEQFQSDESVALYLVDEADVHKWNTEASDIMSMDLGSFVDALDEGMVKWIDEDDEFDLTLAVSTRYWIGIRRVGLEVNTDVGR